MKLNTLYGQLLRSVYALQGLDGQFLADLARPLPRGDRENTREWQRHTLAVVPALRLKRLKRNVSTTKGTITRLRRHFAKVVNEDRVDTDRWQDKDTSEYYERLVNHREELESAQQALKEALA